MAGSAPAQAEYSLGVLLQAPGGIHPGVWTETEVKDLRAEVPGGHKRFFWDGELHKGDFALPNPSGEGAAVEPCRSSLLSHPGSSRGFSMGQ